jgi:hypothetical protein
MPPIYDLSSIVFRLQFQPARARRSNAQLLLPERQIRVPSLSQEFRDAEQDMDTTADSNTVATINDQLPLTAPLTGEATGAASSPSTNV